MEEKKKIFRPSPMAAVVTFIVVMLCMLFVFSYAQYYLGMWGLIITEIGFVVITAIACKVFGLRWGEMLTFRRLKVNQVFGTLFIWGGSLLATALVNMILFYFFPAGLEVNENLSGFLSQWPLPAALLVVSIMPAVCEEVLHRGFIQRCLSTRIHNKWVMSIIMALFFGAFHMDPYRFVGTAILGGVMAYILIETDNFWYNMLFHFVNNFFAQAVSSLTFATKSDVTLDVSILPLSIAVYCMLCSVVPFLLLGGSMLLKGMARLREMGKTKIIVMVVVATVIAAVLFVIGMSMMVMLVLSGGMNDLL